ncbi:MAG: TrkA family potassium uptake protein [Eubacteriales bacterium]|nr:TrkA family potassium uptake protein [Eubacteriales bacterium]NCC82152.1 TrkA family potassium uptake protein [Clostridia bacterium]
MKKQVVVIGLGPFGASVAKSLAEQGHQVLGIDLDEKKVNAIANQITQSAIIHNISEETLVDLGVKEFDIAVVSISDIESSILFAQILMDLGIKEIVSRAQDELHGRVLERLGVSKVVFPERDMGLRLANNLVSSSIIDYIELSKEYNVFEISAPEEFFNKTLAELRVRANYNINVIAIKKHNHQGIVIAPPSDSLIEENDILVVIGKNSDLSKLGQ